MPAPSKTSPSGPLRRLKRHVPLIAILALALAVRLFYLRQASVDPAFGPESAGPDAVLYHRLALRVATGDLLLGPDLYYFSPVYAYLLGILYALLGSGPWVAPLLSLAAGLGNIVLLHEIGRMASGRVAVGLLSALFAALYGPLVVFDSAPLKTTTGLFFTLLGLWALFHWRSHPDLPRLGWSGIALGLAYAVNGHTLLFIAALGTWLLLDPHASGEMRAKLVTRLGRASSLAAGVLLASAPFVLRNGLVAGTWTLRGANAIHLYIGNQPGAWGGYTPVHGVRPTPRGHFVDARRLASRLAGRPLDDAATEAFWARRSWRMARSNPRRILRLLWSKFLLALNRYEIPNDENYAYLQGRFHILRWLPGTALLLPLGLVGLLRTLGRARSWVPLVLLFLSTLTGLLLGFVTWRYRLPMILATLPAAAALCIDLIGTRTRHWRRTTALVAALLAASWLVNLERVDPVRKRHDLIGAQRMIADSRRLAILNQRLQTTSDDDPTKPHLLHRLARLYKRRLDGETALPLLEQALALDPGNRRLRSELRLTRRLLGEPRPKTPH